MTTIGAASWKRICDNLGLDHERAVPEGIYVFGRPLAVKVARAEAPSGRGQK